MNTGQLVLLSLFIKVSTFLRSDGLVFFTYSTQLLLLMSSLTILFNASSIAYEQVIGVFQEKTDEIEKASYLLSGQ